ncbi:hypothetical protein SAMN05192563_101578 [Paraburkholderia aspalathi]|uniref:Uncharacterized protein n=1 Tax=Paraburkholderia aspalathi TaxID=1324617 RepID=A0A1I7E9R6_9BURK|nr:hypothetical protein SAMN05192563_101578 [Paraburkholderia aspalathi]
MDNVVPVNAHQGVQERNKDACAVFSCRAVDDGRSIALGKRAKVLAEHVNNCRAKRQFSIARRQRFSRVRALHSLRRRFDMRSEGGSFAIRGNDDTGETDVTAARRLRALALSAQVNDGIQAKRTQYEQVIIGSFGMLARAI